MFQVHAVTQNTSNSGISNYLEQFTAKLKRFQTKQTSFDKWRKLCNNDVSLYRTISKYILLHRKLQIRAFQAIWNCLQQNWSGFRRNKLTPSSGASYV